MSHPFFALFAISRLYLVVRRIALHSFIWMNDFRELPKMCGLKNTRFGRDLRIMRNDPALRGVPLRTGVGKSATHLFTHSRACLLVA